jgi:hypothetical protein
MSDQPLFQVIPYPAQRLAAIAVMKVANPPSDHGVDFVHHPFKGHDRPLSFRECGDPVFDFLLGFLRERQRGRVYRFQKKKTVDVIPKDI